MAPARPIVHVVDDDPVILDDIRGLLTDVGYEVAVYDDADSFLQRFVPDRPQPQCLILDVRMPGMSGLGLQRKLREFGLAIPILFLTGHAETGTVVEAVKSGAWDFLEKPIHGQMLRRRVQTALDEDAERSGHLAPARRLREQIGTLSARQRDVLGLLLAGKNTKEIAARLDVGLQTVAKHRSRILEKLAARSVVDLVRRISVCVPEMLPQELNSSVVSG